MEFFIGQIILFAGNFEIRQFATCSGQLMPISANNALFSIIGTTYGGDGRTTFALPDLRGRSAIHQGRGPGLEDYRLGQKGGVETVTLTLNEIPSHSHTLQASGDSGNTANPNGNLLAVGVVPPVGPSAPNVANVYRSGATPNVSLSSNSINNQGGNRSHENRSPYLALNYQIALFGIYPSRN